MNKEFIIFNSSRQWSLARVGWVLVLLPSLYFAVVGGQMPVSNPDLVIIYLLFLFLLIFLIFVGMLCLHYSYRHLFNQAGGLILSLVMLALSLFLTFNFDAYSLITGRLNLLGSVWALVMCVILGVTIAMFLYFRDRSVQLFALTFLVFLIMLLFFIRQLDPDKMLLVFFDGSFLNNWGPAGSLICLFYWVLLLAPLSFLWHTGRFLKQELFPNPDDMPPPIIEN